MNTENMELETLKLPKTGKEVKVRAWITAGQRQRISAGAMKGASIDAETGQAVFNDAFKSFEGTQKAQIEVFVVSFDGKEEFAENELYNLCMDLPETDFEVIQEAISKK